MFKKYFILLSSILVIQAQAVKLDHSSTVGQKLDNTIEWIYNNPKLSLLSSTSAVISSGLLSYKFSRSFKKRVNNSIDEMKINFIEAMIKWESLKEEGLSKSDMLKLAGSAVFGCGLYKANKHGFLDIFKSNKLKTLGILAASALGFKTYKNFNNRFQDLDNPFDALFKTLTKDQLQEINAKYFNDLLESKQLEELLDDEEFTDILDEDQNGLFIKLVNFCKDNKDQLD